MPPTTQINIRRDTAANFTSANPTLALGEIAYETDTRNIKVGDGATAWTALPYINPYRNKAGIAGSNVILGHDAGGNSNTANTVFVGAFAGRYMTSVSNNVAVGYASLGNTGSGGQNTAVGMSAANSVSGSNNTAVGYNAILLSTANDITAVGAEALDANTTGTGNTAVGRNALGANTTGASNTAVGFGAASQITTGGSNVAMGDGALNSNQTGGSNVALGSQALSANTGNFSTAVGSSALRLATSTGINTAVGSSALGSLTTGGHNAAFGSGALFLNVDGSSNAAFGRGSLENTTTGSNNAALGRDAGRLRGSGTDALASADNSIFIGHDCRAAGNSQTNQIVIGQGAIGNGSNTTTIGNSSTTDTYLAGSVQCNSAFNTYGYYRTAAVAGSEVFVLRGRNSSTTNESTSRILLDVFNGAGGSSWFQSSNVVGPSAWATGSYDALFTTEQGSADLHLGSGARVKKVTIKSGGDVQVLTGNLVIGTSGKGIDFSATANGTGTMTSELLSDYEEGTFTVTVTSGITTPTYTTQLGRYTKIGRMVYFSIHLVINTGTANANQLKYGGLPFTSNATFTGGVWFANGGGIVAAATPLPTAFVTLGNTVIDFNKNDGTSFVGTDMAGFAGTTTLLCGVYTT